MPWPKHRRSRQTEAKIFDAYLGLRHQNLSITPKSLARTAGVSRATIYRHHFRIGKVRKTYTKLLLEEYKRSIAKHKQTMSAGQLLYYMLLFISHHEKVCYYLLEQETTLHEMLRFIKKELSTEYGLEQTTSPFFDIYIAEAYAIISNWRKTHFSEKLIDIAHHDLILLARTATIRLSGILLVRRDKR